MPFALLFLSLLSDSYAIQELEIVLSADCSETGDVYFPVKTSQDQALFGKETENLPDDVVTR